MIFFTFFEINILNLNSKQVSVTDIFHKSFGGMTIIFGP